MPSSPCRVKVRSSCSEQAFKDTPVSLSNTMDSAPASVVEVSSFRSTTIRRVSAPGKASSLDASISHTPCVTLLGPTENALPSGPATSTWEGGTEGQLLPWSRLR